MTIEGNWMMGAPCLQECSRLEAQMQEQKQVCEALENRIANLKKVNEKVTADFYKYVSASKKELMDDLIPFFSDIYDELINAEGVPGRDSLKEIRNLLRSPDWKRLNWMKDPRELSSLLDITTSVVCKYKSLFKPIYMQVLCGGKKIIRYGEIGGKGFLSLQDLKYLIKTKNDQQFAKELMSNRIQSLNAELCWSYIQLHSLQRDINICYQRQQKVQKEEEPKDYIGVPGELEGWEPTADVPTAPSVMARPGLMPDDLELLSINMTASFEDAKELARFMKLKGTSLDQKLLKDLYSYLNDLKIQISFRLDWAQFIKTRGSEIYASMPKGPSLLDNLSAIAMQAAISSWNGALNRQFRGYFQGKFYLMRDKRDGTLMYVPGDCAMSAINNPRSPFVIVREASRSEWLGYVSGLAP